MEAMLLAHEKKINDLIEQKIAVFEPKVPQLAPEITYDLAKVIETQAEMVSLFKQVMKEPVFKHAALLETTLTLPESQVDTDPAPLSLEQRITELQAATAKSEKVDKVWKT